MRVGRRSYYEHRIPAFLGNANFTGDLAHQPYCAHQIAAQASCSSIRWLARFMGPEITMDCIFCAIARGKAPASVVYEDDTSLAFMSLVAITEGHTLVVPKEHCVTLDDCPAEIAEHLAGVLKKVNRMVAASVRCEGILNELMNGEAAGQEVFHLHWHVIPRYEGDGFGWFYPDGFGKPVPRVQLDEVAARIRRSNADRGV